MGVSACFVSQHSAQIVASHTCQMGLMTLNRPSTAQVATRKQTCCARLALTLSCHDMTRLASATGDAEAFRPLPAVTAGPPIVPRPQALVSQVAVVTSVPPAELGKALWHVQIVPMSDTSADLLRKVAYVERKRNT